MHPPHCPSYFKQFVVNTYCKVLFVVYSNKVLFFLAPKQIWVWFIYEETNYEEGPKGHPPLWPKEMQKQK